MNIRRGFYLAALFPFLAGCSGKTNWSRPNFEPGGSPARVLYYIPGTFESSLDISSSKHRTDGPPPGTEIVYKDRKSDQKEWDQLLTGFVSKDFEQRDKSTFEKVRVAPHSLTLIGDVNDTKSLKYLRDSIGVVQAALDAGGVAVYDMEGYRWYTPSEWKEKIFDRDKPDIKNQIFLLGNLEVDNPKLYYLHTQGMRKFGRPDLAVKNVKQEELVAVETFFFAKSEEQMRGKLLKNGAKLTIASLNKTLQFILKDGNEDPLFNNMYLESSLR